ncbi:heterokaryon incompatibility protein-domain-containing protein [Rhypophila decipiens]|uniref:Heterokaryon incompatibility protein-domain-containing protein n=1 Tax=Rhypophila decipiens TaxID=261697 RepID=A0AAN6YD44_9PEZI|nr:heterokaryon incompatibility protein-domain-containing protein [Rhypophila decipiens]
MRLIDTKTLHIQEFTGPKVPRYAILSHTWGDQELTYQDWLYVHEQSPKRWGWVQLPEEIQRLKSTDGYVKVLKACEYARQHNSNCQWLWADTVCIDKSSSAELSEAINSMFEWYRRAEVCYALLVDVPTLSSEELAKCSYRTSAFRQSRWFRRGWTLQELVAPWSVVFLSQDWTRLGTKSSLAKHIATITSIPESCLSGNWDRIRDQTSIAQKMSWAAWRQTTRIEDQAYCLMGLFRINMPLLYGEGEKAFRRLQQEIIKKTGDLSFLAWQSKRSQTFARDHFIHWELPTLAVSPSRFSSARNVKLKKTTEILATKRVFTSNTGTFIHRPRLSTLDGNFVFAPLNSEVLTTSRPAPKSVWIPLSRNGPSQGWTRSSFPASTIVTALDPYRCEKYKGSPSATCLLDPYEPSSTRHYFRKSHPRGFTARTKPSRQVCIVPVFATPSPWIEVVESHPHSDKLDSLMITLAEVDEYIYHGLTVFKDVGDADASHEFAVHFLVIFGRDSNRPVYWNVEPGFHKYEHRVPSEGDLARRCYEITDSILGKAKQSMDKAKRSGIVSAAAGIDGNSTLKDAREAVVTRAKSPDLSYGYVGSYDLSQQLLAVLKRSPETLARAHFLRTLGSGTFMELDSHCSDSTKGGSYVHNPLSIRVQDDLDGSRKEEIDFSNQSHFDEPEFFNYGSDELEAESS